MMAKIKNVYVCQVCGNQAHQWVGRCGDCGEWNTYMEERSLPVAHLPAAGTARPLTLTEITMDEEERTAIGLSEMDRVLGGGLVQGSVSLVGGDPGIGKSTLLLQVAEMLGQKGKQVLYVSAEESLRQIKLRAERLQVSSCNLKLLAESSLERILQVIAETVPAAVVIDSVQTVHTAAIQSAPGSVSQVREVAGMLTATAKEKNVALFLIGHVTKDGSIAGPRVMEHIVDTVLYFEGDQGHTFRILRTMKNRFGSTQEIGVFEMKEQGLVQVENPSQMFLAERPHAVTGSVVVPNLEGTRPILVELQALVAPVEFGVPRRTTTGVDRNRVNLLMAVLEKRCAIPLQNQDIFVNVVGGMTLNEPAADLAIIAAVASNFRGVAIEEKTFLFGEVGLGGEVRAVSRPQARIGEAAKLGFQRCILPRRCLGEKGERKMEVIGIDSIEDLLNILF